LTLIIEALTSIELKIAGQIKALRPGERLDLPEGKAMKLLRLAVGKVRVMGGELHSDMWIQFRSPLFGEVMAQVHGLEIGQVWITQHSTLRQAGPVKIPAEWVTRVFPVI
jgi:hypothetical protein